MPIPRRIGRVIGAVVAAAAAAGCGGNDEEEEPARTVTVAAGEAVEVVGVEYTFDPSRVVVEGGGPVEITLQNQGSIAHNLTVLEGGTEVGATPTFGPGQARSTEIEVDPGTYRMVCTVGAHEELGMVGELEVR